MASRMRKEELFRQKDLAATLKRIRDKGRDGFYTGETAKLIVAEMKRGADLLRSRILKIYASVIRDPVQGTYRGYEIISTGPPSSGGVALVQMLNILEGYNLEEYRLEFVESRSPDDGSDAASLCGQCRISGRPRFRENSRRMADIEKICRAAPGNN